MPGIVKRVAINYYGRSMMYAAGVPKGLERPDPQWFEPISATTERHGAVGDHARWTARGASRVSASRVH